MYLQLLLLHQNLVLLLIMLTMHLYLHLLDLLLLDLLHYIKKIVNLFLLLQKKIQNQGEYDGNKGHQAHVNVQLEC